jgi:hypothetical protein
MTTPWVGPPGITGRDITRALRKLYPDIPNGHIRQEGGTFLVGIPGRIARYWGVERDPRHAAAWITRNLPRPVEIRGVVHKGGTAFVTLAVSDQPRPADPGSSRGIPRYTTVDEVIGDFPATRPVRALIQAALDGGLRPHLNPSPSPHGPRYRVVVQGDGRNSLIGVLDISETKGQFAEAWLVQGNGPEIRYRRDQVRLVREQITAARDQRRDEAASRGPARSGRIDDASARLAGVEYPVAAAGARSPSTGPAARGRQAASTGTRQHRAGRPR